MWKGSRVDYSDITFSRKYHPPIPHILHSNVIAEYDIDNNKQRWFLPGFKKRHGNHESNHLWKEVINVLSHEPLHGVIMYCLYKDRYNGTVNLEWPMYNGLDPEHTKNYKKDKHKHKGRIF